MNHIEDINDEMDLDEDPAMTYNKLVLLADETTVPRVEIVSNQLNNSEEEVLYEISEEGPIDNTKDPSLIEESIKIKQSLKYAYTYSMKRDSPRIIKIRFHIISQWKAAGVVFQKSCVFIDEAKFHKKTSARSLCVIVVLTGSKVLAIGGMIDMCENTKVQGKMAVLTCQTGYPTDSRILSYPLSIFDCLVTPLFPLLSNFHIEMHYREIISAKIQSFTYVQIVVKYTSDTADSVGTSCKRNQSFEMKQEKKEAKKQKTNTANVACSNCKEVGHSLSRSPFCKNNHRVTNGTILPSDIISAWNTFYIKYPAIICKINLASGNSQCISEACTTVATSYLNNIVELFEAKILRYIRYILQNAFMTMNPDHIAKISKEFCYQMVCQGDPVWPKNIQLSEGQQARIKEVCTPLSSHIDIKVTLKSLSASPGKFVRSLAYILSEYEREHLAHNPYDVRRLLLPRLFAISPSPSFHWRFVTISVNSLCCFIKEKLPRGYNAQLDLFYKCFDFKSLGFKSIDYLHPGGLNDVLFANTIKSDGFTVDFLFEKRRATARQESKNYIENHDLDLKDFEYITLYLLILVERRCIQQQLAWIQWIIKLDDALLKNLTIIETNIPTQKTCSSISYERFIQYIINHKDKLFDFYGVDATLTDNMYFIEVASGNLQCFTKKREAAGDLLVVTVDEFKTSRICCRCGTDSLDGVAHVKGHSVLVCKTCNTLWQRDVNAAKNMMTISLSIWKGMGRP
ncbi:hypothetical protein MFLAVUS_011127 [Mucor flavus]|uniref:Cas12f1-like TNB domain-containing protein n=1 Tax=Mucor flavus TaxID=439312 RepID=A0ABP9ZEN3_9FUNG